MNFVKRLIKSSKYIAMTSVFVLSLMISAFPLSVSAQAAPTQDQFFTEAAKEFNVPKELLLAISYSESRWQSRGSAQSIDGGYGLMSLKGSKAAEDGRGTGQTPLHVVSHGSSLGEAAKLLQASPDTLKQDDRQNIRGAAAVLADYAKQLHDGKLPTDLADWYEVAAKYSGAISSESAQLFADEVYKTMQEGASAVVTNNTAMRLDANPNLAPKTEDLQKLNLPSQAARAGSSNSNIECPNDLNCRFVPARYAKNGDGTDPAKYGNHDHANRPHDMKIKYIIIHDTEGPYQGAINWFQDEASGVSCDYVIRSSDGEVTQMVRNQDVAWCSGDWYLNMHGINIEHEGIAAQGKDWYTEEMYQSSAKLVRHLAKKYNIPLDREHIIGHDGAPAISPSRMLTNQSQKWDPGPYWDWNHYMALLHGVSDEAERASQAKATGATETVTIAPNFDTNQPVLTNCPTSDNCVTLPTQGSNLVHLHTQPNNTSPLLSDKYFHPDNSPGTNRAEDWGSKATDGQRYAVAGQEGDWTGIWYGGKIGWFHNPPSNPTAHKSRSTTITPRAGLESIPIYGAAYPEAAAYPEGVEPQVLEPLYTMPAGQSYVAKTKRVPTDYFYAPTINSSLPHDHEVIVGQEKYYQITYNKRIFFVKASDVTVQRPTAGVQVDHKVIIDLLAKLSEASKYSSIDWVAFVKGKFEASNLPIRFLAGIN